MPNIVKSIVIQLLEQGIGRQIKNTKSMKVKSRNQNDSFTFSHVSNNATSLLNMGPGDMTLRPAVNVMSCFHMRSMSSDITAQGLCHLLLPHEVNVI